MGDWSISMTLSILPRPRILSCSPGFSRAAYSRRRSARSSVRFTSVLLPEPLTPVTQMIPPRGNLTLMSLRLFSRQPRSSSTLRRLSFRRRVGVSISHRPGEVLARHRLGGLADVRQRALADDPPAVPPGRRAHVDDLVGAADRLLVVLDDDHRVAHVPQVDERADQPCVVPLVQADRRLVEHVADADQPAADLRGQADPLGLAAGQRRRRAVQRDVVEAHVGQEPHAMADLAEDRSSAICVFSASSLSPSKNASASVMLIRVTSSMFLSPTVTARLAGLSRAPLHARQGCSERYPCSRALTYSLSVLFQRRSRLGITPSQPRDSSPSSRALRTGFWSLGERRGRRDLELPAELSQIAGCRRCSSACRRGARRRRPPG